MNKNKNAKLLVAYGYGIEFLLAGLTVIVLWQFGWFANISKFLEDTASSLATLFGIMLASALAARLVFFSLNSGDFSAWLEWKRLGGIVSGVFLFNLLLVFAATVTSVALVYVKGTWLSSVGVVVTVIALINTATSALFVYRLSRLHAVFNFEFKKANEAERGKCSTPQVRTPHQPVAQGGVRGSVAAEGKGSGQ